MYRSTSSGAALRAAGPAESADSAGRLRRDSFDGEYVERLRAGDPTTEGHFASYFGELLRIKLYARYYQAHRVEDLRQETLLRVLTALKSKNCLRSPESLGAYVNSVCNNLLLESGRSDSRFPAVVLDEHFDAPGCQATAESEMVDEERRQQVRRVLDELPSKDRKLLRMLFYDEADRDEICRTFRVERQYLRVLVHRAKARFRECLMKQYPDGSHA